MHRLEPAHGGTGLRIGVVMSRFNEPVCRRLLDACLAALADSGMRDDDVTLATVPGALEIPLALQRCAQSGRFDALVALGCVIRGETYHFEVVSNESARGISEVALEFGIPVANGVLTVETDAQAESRAAQKGADAARVAIEMARLCEQLGAPKGYK